MVSSSNTSSQRQNKYDRRVASLSCMIAVIDTAKAAVTVTLVRKFLSAVSNFLDIAKNEDEFRALTDKCQVVCDVVTKASEGLTNGELGNEVSDIIISLKHFVQDIHDAVVSSVTYRTGFVQSYSDKISLIDGSLILRWIIGFLILYEK